MSGDMKNFTPLEAPLETLLALLISVVDGVVEAVLTVEIAIVKVEGHGGEGCAMEIARVVRQRDVVG